MKHLLPIACFGALLGLTGCYVAPTQPVYYRPAPAVVYARPPAYYPPPPVYARPPVVVVRPAPVYVRPY